MSERDSLMERLLSGETDVTDPAVRRLFESDPSAREEYQSLKELEGSLERQGNRAREVVEASRQLPDRGDAERVLETLTQLAQRTPPAASRTRSGPSLVWLALAATVIATLAWGWWARSPQREKEILMGPGSPQSSAAFAITSPVGAVEQYPPFTWTGELKAGEWFVVKVYDADRPDSEAIQDSGAVFGNQWSPDPDRAPTTWPARIFLTVQRFNAAGRPIGSPASAEAFLQA